VETKQGQAAWGQSEWRAVFQGHPPGEATRGANRFRPPVPVTPWAGIRDAQVQRLGPAESRRATRPGRAWYGTIRPISEDCLFLNVLPRLWHDRGRGGALVGTGAHTPRLVRETMSRWTTMLDPESHLANNPGGEARKMLDDLPYFEYSRPASFVHA
jgi:Carboxylesterase family